MGTFDPAIEIWNLDVMDPLEPSAVLGGAVTSLKPKKKKNPVMKEGSHTESVLGLSWNRVYRPALASGSADATIKIWDVTTQQCSHTFAQHSDKVQTVQWHPSQAWLLSSGSFDKTVCLFDCRSASVCAVYSLPSDVEVRLIVLIMVSLFGSVVTNLGSFPLSSAIHCSREWPGGMLRCSLHSSSTDEFYRS